MQTTEKILLATEEQTYSFSLSHKQQLMEAFRCMDLTAFEKLLSEEQTYGDENKWKFLAGLKSQFEAFRSAGDTELIACGGICKGCRFEMKGFRFTGNHSGQKIEFIFDEKDNEVMDLFSCDAFQAEGDEPFITLGGLVARAGKLCIPYDSITDLIPQESFNAAP